MDSMITDILIEQILAIRDSGKVNMLDELAVQVEANQRRLYELVVFIEEYRKEYMEFILTGKR